MGAGAEGVGQATKKGKKPQNNILDDSDSEGGGGPGAGGGGGPSLSINRGFANAYEERKRKQELGKARDMGFLQGGWGDDDEEEEDESTSESEDEGEALTPFMDVEIMRTIHMIRSKDPRVYDPNTKFYQKTGGGEDSEEGEGGEGQAGGKKVDKVCCGRWGGLVQPPLVPLPVHTHTRAPMRTRGIHRTKGFDCLVCGCDLMFSGGGVGCGLGAAG